MNRNTYETLNPKTQTALLSSIFLLFIVVINSLEHMVLVFVVVLVNVLVLFIVVLVVMTIFKVISLLQFLLALSIGQRLCVNFYVSRANFLTTCVHT